MSASRQIIKAVTVHRPWGYAIAHLDKMVENRSWECKLPIGSFIAIHNGQKWDADAAKFIGNLNPTKFIDDPTPENDPPQSIIAVGIFAGNIFTSESPWFFGPIGWQIERIVAIDPVACPGQQGLWTLSPDVLDQVRVEYSKSTKTI